MGKRALRGNLVNPQREEPRAGNLLPALSPSGAPYSGSTKSGEAAVLITLVNKSLQRGVLATPDVTSVLPQAPVVFCYFHR